MPARWRCDKHPTAEQKAAIDPVVQDIVNIIESAGPLPTLAESPTWPHVLAFAKRMEAKLAKNRHKGDREGWLKDDPWSLVERVLDETVELQQCFTHGSDGRIDFEDAEKTANECADVANFCMMVADTVTTLEGTNPPSIESVNAIKQ